MFHGVIFRFLCNLSFSIQQSRRIYVYQVLWVTFACLDAIYPLVTLIRLSEIFSKKLIRFVLSYSNFFFIKIVYIFFHLEVFYPQLFICGNYKLILIFTATSPPVIHVLEIYFHGFDSLLVM